MTYRLDIMPAVAGDLEAIRLEDPKSASRIGVAIVEIKNDQNLLDNLLVDRYGQRNGERFTHTMGVQFIGEFARQRPRRDIWRFKCWELENLGVQYRVVYAYFAATRRFFVLAVAPKAWNYDYSHPLSTRIAADYDRLLADFG